MSEPKFKIGDDVCVYDPSRYVRGAVCIHGIIDRIEPMGSAWKYSMLAEVVNPYPKPHGLKRVFIHEIDLLHSIGTPISQLDGRNGGNDAWQRISNSWGYP